MPRFKKSSTSSSQKAPSYKSLYVNPLTELKRDRSHSGCSAGGNLNLHLCGGTSVVCDKENNGLFHDNLAKVRSVESCKGKSPVKKGKRHSKNVLQSWDKNVADSAVAGSTSLQFCIQINEPDSKIGRFNKTWTPNKANVNENAMYVWDDSDTEAAPVPSWSTLPNRSLLCRPLPLDIGRCTCYIVKERCDGLDHSSVYSLYTNEGHGRQDRKLAIARHRRRGGRSEFIIAQSCFGILSQSDEGYLGMVTANLVGSRYHIWDQRNSLDSQGKDSKQLLGAVTFVPTVTTLTGNFRSMRACIPKPQSMQTKNITQHINGLPIDWEDNLFKVHQLFSKVPYYNKDNKRYELDFRDRARVGLHIRTSVKNFQLTMEENGKQSILLLGKVGKSKYIMDYRFPLSGYQAFCICLASIDSKLCCSV